MYITGCDSFKKSEYPGLIDLSPQLPVSHGTVLTVKCQRPTRFALITPDNTLTCEHGQFDFDFVYVPSFSKN